MADKEQEKCALNLRGFPVDLKWKCKEKASRNKEKLSQFIERVLRDAVSGIDEQKNTQGKSRAKSKAT